MKPGRTIDDGQCRWINVVGRNRRVLERARGQLALPPHVVALTLSEHPHPTVMRVPPVRFIATYFTSPSRRRVFRRHPLFLWLAPEAIVTISPWGPRRRGVLEVPHARTTERGDLVYRILEAAAASHEDVGWHLNDLFDQQRDAAHIDWHYREHRLRRFGELLERQLQLVQALGARGGPLERLAQQLSGLREIARFAEQKVQESGQCRVCSRDGIVSRREAMRP